MFVLEVQDKIYGHIGRRRWKNSARFPLEATVAPNLNMWRYKPVFVLILYTCKEISLFHILGIYQELACNWS